MGVSSSFEREIVFSLITDMESAVKRRTALSIVYILMKFRPMWEYSFIRRGRDLMPVFYEIMVWGFKHENDQSKND